MAERLTKKISKPIQDKYSLGNYLYYDFAEIDDTNKLLNKLGKLEDIMEKYGIESAEILDRLINVWKLRDVDRTKMQNGKEFLLNEIKKCEEEINSIKLKIKENEKKLRSKKWTKLN